MPENKTTESPLIEKIVSGGQTGIDRAALDVAIEHEISCGGWCPRSRKAEDGTIPIKYPLEETPNEEYVVRTKWNVRDSDGTLILTVGKPTGGTALTVAFAKEYARPLLVIDLDQQHDPQQVANWLLENQISVLNVAGPRESNIPGIYRRGFEFLSGIAHKKLNRISQ